MTEYCSSPFLATFLPAARKTIMIIQIMVPIVLIVAATFKFFSMMKDPEQKNGTKKIINTFVAAVIIFFIPMLVNVVMNLLGNRTTISACWKNAEEFDPTTNYVYYDEQGKKRIFTNQKDYEKGNPTSQGVGAGEAHSVSDKTDYANKALNVVKVVDTNVNNSGRKYRATQAACYTGRHVVYAQNRNYGSIDSSSRGGRICWAILETGQTVKCVEVGAEGGHMDGLAYDNDRGYVLKTSTKNRLMVYDNVTMEFKGYSGIDSIHVGITYVPSIHMLVGYSGGSLIFYKYDASSNKYRRQGAVHLRNFVGQNIQGLGTDGTNIFIADSNPYTSYRRLYTYSLKGAKLETLSFGRGFGALSDEVEAAFADNRGILYLACPMGIGKVKNYVANKIGLQS